MIEISNNAVCCGCSSCVSACPVGCISMKVDLEGFPYPSVDASRCIGCGRCEKVCPFINIPESSPVLFAYAAKTNDDDLRLVSSSGGIFTELCKLVFASGGVVYGVVMSNDCKSCFSTRAECESELAPMRGSKYLQASTEGVFEKVKADLDDGRSVLFSGTPCQANALFAFLGGKRAGLTIVDCACHGVPSPRLWAEYVDEIESAHGTRVKSVDFRCKERGWRKFGLKVRVEESSLYEPLDSSPYLGMFLRNNCLRPSCYACRAKTNRVADITIADFWGIERVLPAFSDDLGVSLVLIRTQHGVDLFDALAGRIQSKRVLYDDAICGNPAEHSSVARPPERDAFFCDLDKLGYRGIVKKYGRQSAAVRIKRAIKRMLCKAGVLSG